MREILSEKGHLKMTVFMGGKHVTMLKRRGRGNQDFMQIRLLQY